MEEAEIRYSRVELVNEPLLLNKTDCSTILILHNQLTYNVKSQ